MTAAQRLSVRLLQTTYYRYSCCMSSRSLPLWVRETAVTIQQLCRLHGGVPVCCCTSRPIGLSSSRPTSHACSNGWLTAVDSWDDGITHESFVGVYLRNCYMCLACHYSTGNIRRSFVLQQLMNWIIKSVLVPCVLRMTPLSCYPVQSMA